MHFPQPGSTSPRLTVSIVSHGQGSLLDPLLRQLRDAAAVLPMHVIVTQNLPELRTPIESQTGFVLDWIENAAPRGFGENHNSAFRLCTTEFFCVMNPDVRLTPESLTPLLASVTQKAGVAGPRVMSPAGRVEDSARRVPTPLRLCSRWWRRRFEADYAVEPSEQQVDWLAGMCLVFDRATFHAVSGFDERYRLYCEDVDICLRVHLAGRAVSWVQNGIVVHDAQRTSHRNWRYRMWHIRSLFRLLSSVAYWRFRIKGHNNNIH